MADRKATGLNNQKRGVSVLVADLVEADVLTTGSTYATLPAGSLITSVGILTTTASGTTNADLAVDYNGSALEAAILVNAATFVAGTPIAAASYSATGGDIVVKAGSTTPAAGDFVGKLIIEYIELPKVTGEYTN